MTDSTESLPPTAENKAASGPKTEKKRSLSWALILVVILLAAFSIAASIYFWQSLQQQQAVIAHINTQKNNDQQRIQSLENSIGQRLSSIESERQRHTDLLGNLNRQSLFNTQKLTEMGASSRADWLLAEAEYLLHLANQRLMLEHDQKSTEAILISADKVLAEVNDPGLFPVREALNKEILSLQQLPEMDRDGIYMKLAAMIASLDSLNESAFLTAKSDESSPPAMQLPPIDSELPVWKKVWREVWSDLKQAVVIRRLDQPVAPLLAPEQNYYLKQNLRLMLEQASLALLEQNEVLFHHSARQASQWINNYFDTQDNHTQALLNSVDALQKLAINYDKPDISNSLRLLKTKIEAMYLSHSLGKLSKPTPEYSTSEKQESAQ